MSQTNPSSIPHKRLTADQVKRNWLLGDYTASGYLYHLIGALRKDGWPLLIDNVDEFCQEWEISRRSFYRAKAKLIVQGRINEEIIGKVKIWINDQPTIVPFHEDGDDSDCAKFGTVSDTSGIPCAKFGTASDTSGTTTEVKPLSHNQLQISPDLLQINSSSFPSKRETNQNFVQKEKIEEQAVLFGQKDQIQPNYLEQNIVTDWDKFSAPGRDPSFFEFVLRRVAKFENPVPADPKCTAEGWIQKQGHILYPEYLEWKAKQHQAQERQRLTQVQPSLAPEPEGQPEETLEKRLVRYQHQWSIPACRPGIQKVIAQHPEWGIFIGRSGPEVALAS